METKEIRKSFWKWVKEKRPHHYHEKVNPKKREDHSIAIRVAFGAFTVRLIENGELFENQDLDNIYL